MEDVMPALLPDFSIEKNEPEIYPVSLKKEEFLYMASEKIDKAYEIEKGYMKLSRYSDGGKETILSILKPGDMLGNFIPSQLPSFAHEHAQALTKVELKVYEGNILKHAIQNNPSFVMKILTAQQKRNLLLQRQMASIAFMDVPQRLRNFLKFLGEEYGKIRDCTAFLDGFLTHHDISLINQTSRQSVSTVLSKLKAQKIIYYDRYQLIIKLDKLNQKMAEG